MLRWILCSTDLVKYDLLRSEETRNLLPVPEQYMNESKSSIYKRLTTEQRTFLHTEEIFGAKSSTQTHYQMTNKIAISNYRYHVFMITIVTQNYGRETLKLQRRLDQKQIQIPSNLCKSKYLLLFTPIEPTPTFVTRGKYSYNYTVVAAMALTCNTHTCL